MTTDSEAQALAADSATSAALPAGFPVPTHASHIDLHELGFRPDGEEWIVGLPATGEVAAVPPAAVTFIKALMDGATVGEAKVRTDLAHADDVDALDFVATLADLGFVARVDGRGPRHEPPPPPSLPRLLPRHVRWTLGRGTALAVAAVTVLGFGLAALGHTLPTTSVYFALHRQGLNLLLATAISLAMIAAHEFCHLATARAAGVHARIGLGTRLSYLVVQTTLPGLWLADRAARIRVFVAGMACDLTIGALAAATATLTPAPGLPHRLAALVSLIAVLSVASEFAFYMRTDVYFVVQDLLRCHNLFEDAVTYLRHRADRTHRADQTHLADLADHERRAVRLYAVLVLVGSAVTLAIAAAYGVPVAAQSNLRSLHEVVTGLHTRDLPQAADGTAALLATVPLEALLITRLLRKHAAGLLRGLLPKHIRPDGPA